MRACIIYVGRVVIFFIGFDTHYFLLHSNTWTWKSRLKVQFVEFKSFPDYSKDWKNYDLQYFHPVDLARSFISGFSFYSRTLDVR